MIKRGSVRNLNAQKRMQNYRLCLFCARELYLIIKKSVDLLNFV